MTRRGTIRPLAYFAARRFRERLTAAEPQGELYRRLREAGR